MSRPEPRPVSWHELNRIRGRAVATATGTVLEVGAGSGDNFAHFAHDVTWIGLEPHAKSRAALERTAHALGHDRPVLAATAERIPLADATVDAVVATFVMCSVDDVAQALREFRRVLVPGGLLVLVDHVAAPAGTGTRLLQNFVSPVSRRVDKGCRWNRDITPEVERAGFSGMSVERYRMAALGGLLAVPCAVHMAHS